MWEVFRDPIWQFVGVVIAAAGIVATFLLFRKQYRRKRLSYCVVSSTPLLSEEEELKGNLEILYNGEPVRQVHLVLVKIFNSGNAPIVSDDYERRVSVGFGKEARILSAEIVKTQPSSLRMSPSVEDDSIVLPANLLNPTDSVELKVFVSNFEQIFQLIPEKLRPESRKKFRAYDGINNAFNLAYEVLSWKVHRALVKAKLEPFLGFLHSTAYSKPSVVCDFLELYRYLAEDFLIQYCRDLRVGDFVVKSEWASGKKNRKGKRDYLSDLKTREMLKQLNRHFESMAKVPRMRIGKRQTIETLINEEALLLAKFLRSETATWRPRIQNTIEREVF